jgi:acetyl-CoA carboxylase biotin carboxyl carrier protein
MAPKKKRADARGRSDERRNVAPVLVSGQLVDELDTLAELIARRGLGEVEIQRGDVYVRLSAGGSAPGVAIAAPRAPMAAPAQKLETATETTDGNVSYITSPFVGSFYRAPNPEAAPFVDEGTKFKKGQVLCIVEAMKLMNEIEAEVDGVIVQILVENGQPVEYGEPLFKIRQG